MPEQCLTVAHAAERLGTGERFVRRLIAEGRIAFVKMGASLKDLMVRMGHSSVRAAMVHQHSTERRQRELAAKMESRVRRDMGTQQPRPPLPGPPHGTSDWMATVHPIRRHA
ncbi:excisionase family DNA-binding protein [Kitasatospora phosalacinea]|uniref:Helix-turn-helix domain-containing protein n=1 Tax=Kitasatospora phosalacinea TaxID=2065 RepID=A0A9W6PNL4_9ACTN|nr:hypothetical protein Kpho01_61590 [Kitasatospora phosalacinea]